MVSCLPGRIRVRHPALRRSADRARLEAAFGAMDGMVSVDGNAAVGSLLLRYDTARCEPAAMEARVGALIPPAAGEAATRPPPAGTWATRPASRSGAKRLNRLAKIGMVTSFPLSLAFAAFGSKQLHAVSGGAFTLLLLVHLIVHRRNLVR